VIVEKGPLTLHSSALSTGRCGGVWMREGLGVSRGGLEYAELSFVPFRGTDAVARGLLTKDMLKSRTWRRLMPDVYVRADAYDADDHRMWCAAVALTLRAGEAVDRYSAAYLWGVNLLTPTAPVTVSVRSSARPWPHPRRQIVRTILAFEDIAELHGVPLTTPVRTAFDLGRQPCRTSALIALDAMCHRRSVRQAELTDYAAKRVRWPGGRRLLELLSLVDPRAESPMETRLRLLLSDAGAPPPVPQHEVRNGAGRLIGRVDLAYPQWRIAIEYEGDHHRERAQFRRDITRSNALREAGWILLRFTADDVLGNPARVLAQVAAAIRERQG
jgi:hypothetical protein